MCILAEKEVSKMLLFIVKIGHDEMKIMKGCTLAYFTTAQYDNLSTSEKNNKEDIVTNISAATVKCKI